jgi:sulfate/thiosulfate transport system permease protein
VPDAERAGAVGVREADAHGAAAERMSAYRSAFPEAREAEVSDAGFGLEAAAERFGRPLLAAAVFLYLAIVLLAPLGALLSELWQIGVRPMVHALLTPQALSALWMTLLLTLISVSVNAVLGTLGGIALVRHRFIGRSLINALADLPLAISPVMIGLCFVLLVGRGGWLAGPLEALDVKVLFAFPGLVIASLFVTLPFTIREVAYVLEELGTNEEEAAATLGASPLQTFWRVTLPNVRLGLGYGLLMTAARSLGEFGALLVLGGSISQQTQTATTFIHDALEERDPAGAYGMALVLAVLSVGLWYGLERFKAARKS